MSHTNTTANYNLPQFVGTDKPSWLTDVNGAMTSIDAQMKANADANTTTAGDLTTLAGRVTNSENAIQAQATQISTATSLAQSASTSATNANTSINELKDYLALNTFSSYDKTNLTTSNGAMQSSQLYTARNSDGSLGKVYGFIGVNSMTSSGNVTITASVDTGFRPSEEINIVNAGIAQLSNNDIVGCTMTIKTNGTLAFTFNALGQNGATIRLMPSLYFITNFGDLPE